MPMTKKSGIQDRKRNDPLKSLSSYDYFKCKKAHQASLCNLSFTLCLNSYYSRITPFYVLFTKYLNEYN